MTGDFSDHLKDLNILNPTKIQSQLEKASAVPSRQPRLPAVGESRGHFAVFVVKRLNKSMNA